MSNITLMHDCGIEALFFDRFIRFLLLLFGSSAVVVTPAIMTFNYFLGSADSVDPLDRFSWSSLAPEQAEYYWIYAAFVPCFAGYTLVHITYELNRAVSVRMRLSKDYCREHGTDSRQFFVGVTGIPTDLQDERKIRAYYQHWETHIRSVRFVRSDDIKGDLSMEREQLIRNIERCEMAFILKEMKLSAGDKIDIQRRVTGRLRHRYIGFSSYEKPVRGRLLRAMSHWIPYEMRPVSWLYQTLVGINREIDREQRKFPQGAGSALMEVDDYLIAQALSVARLSMNAPYLKVQYLGSDRSRITLSNIRGPYHRVQARRGGIDVCIVAFIILWTVPVGASGFLSQLSSGLYLIYGESKLPPWLIGPLQGIAPQLATSAFVDTFPFVLRTLTSYKQYPTMEGSHVSVQSFYSYFLFTQLFITTSVSSGLIPTLVAVLDSGITRVPRLLAQNLPLASTYFLSFVFLQAMSLATSTLLRGSAWFRRFRLLLDPTKGKGTPKDLVERIYDVHDRVDWGKTYPLYCTIANIGMLSSYFRKVIAK